MQLYLVRHGIAIDREDPQSPTESERYLTPEGIERTRASARGMKALSLQPKIVLSSPWLRARQTAEIVMQELGIALSRLSYTDALLWDANPQRLMHELGVWKASATVLCVGHAPHLDHFVAHAVGAKQPFTALKKASLACLELSTIQAGGAVLEALLSPKVLRTLGQ